MSYIACASILHTAGVYYAYRECFDSSCVVYFTFSRLVRSFCFNTEFLRALHSHKRVRQYCISCSRFRLFSPGFARHGVLSRVRVSWCSVAQISVLVISWSLSRFPRQCRGHAYSRETLPLPLFCALRSSRSNVPSIAVRDVNAGSVWRRSRRVVLFAISNFLSRTRH